MVMVKRMQESGAIIIVFVIGIIMANDRTLFRENSGTIKFGKKWCGSISKLLGYVKKATTVKPVIAHGLTGVFLCVFYHE